MKEHLCNKSSGYISTLAVISTSIYVTFVKKKSYHMGGLTSFYLSVISYLMHCFSAKTVNNIDFQFSSKQLWKYWLTKNTEIIKLESKMCCA